MQYLYEGVIVPASVIIPVCIALYRYNMLPQACRVLLYYIVFAGCINVAAAVLAANNIRNLPLLHAYTIIEAMLLLWFYKIVLAGTKIAKVIPVTVAVFAILCIVNAVFLQSIYNFNSYTRPVEALIIAACSLAWLTKTKDEADNTRWIDNPINLMNAGVLVYFSGAFILFAFSNIITGEGSRAIKTFIWNMHATLVLIMYLLFAAGFSKCHRKQTI